MKYKSKLIELIRKQSLKRGGFTLANGQQSDCYIDLSMTALTSEGLSLICWILYDKVSSWNEIDSIGGPALGAVPIVSGLTFLFSLVSNPKRSFVTREAPKTHGSAGIIDGPLQKGDRVLLIEDVTTTGTSLLHAAQVVETAGAIISDTISILDREQGAGDLLKSSGYSFTSLVTISDILKK